MQSKGIRRGGGGRRYRLGANYELKLFLFNLLSPAEDFWETAGRGQAQSLPVSPNLSSCSFPVLGPFVCPAERLDLMSISSPTFLLQFHKCHPGSSQHPETRKDPATHPCAQSYPPS